MSSTPTRTLELLADPAFVTPMLGDLLDQQRSRATEPVRWVLPRLHVGGGDVLVVLAPRWTVTPDRVVIDAPSTEEADAQVQLRLTCSAVADGEGAVLTTAWTLRMRVPLPRVLVRLARPALDRSIGNVVEEITRRTASGVSAA